MTRRVTFGESLARIGLLVAAAALPRAFAADDAGMDHSKHQGMDHSGHSMGVPDMDANGRRLDPNAAQHDMTPEQLAELREKIALYRALRCYGPMSREKLVDLCAPDSLLAGKYTGSARMANKTLTRWTQLGFFVQEGDAVRVSEAVASSGMTSYPL